MIEYSGLFFENIEEVENFTKLRKKSKSQHTPEGEILSLILDYLTSRRCLRVWRNNTGVARTGGRYIRYGEKGLADIIGYHTQTGRHIEIEVKAGIGQRRADQIARIDDATSAGCIAFFAGSVEELNANLKKFGLI